MVMSGAVAVGHPDDMAAPEPSTQTDFGCHVQVAETGGRLQVTLTGEIDLQCEELFAGEVLPLAGRYPARDVVVDCSQLEYIDLRGLELLLQVSSRAQPGGRVRLVEPNRSLSKLMEYTKTEALFEVVSSG